MDSNIILYHLRNLDAVYTLEPNRRDGYITFYGDGSGDYSYDVFHDNYCYEYDHTNEVFDFNSLEEFCEKATELTRANPI